MTSILQHQKYSNVSRNLIPQGIQVICVVLITNHLTAIISKLYL